MTLRYKCPECDCLFNYQYELEEHIVSKHKWEEPKVHSYLNWLARREIEDDF